MKISVVIIGYGSIAKKHFECLKRIKTIKKIYIYSKRNINYKYSLNTIKNILEIDPQYIVIASNTSDHFKHLQYIINNLNNKIILVEKPLFHKFLNLRIKKNKVFVGYNLRMHPILLFLKKQLKDKKIFSVDILCESFLPEWRKNRNYVYTSSANKDSGGGVLLDLSHELDYLQWIFGSITPIYVKNLKLSNLKINTDDYLFLYATNKEKIHFNLSINFYSRIQTRQISIKGDNISIKADLISNKIIQIKHKQKKEFFFNKFNIINTYFDLHNKILSANHSEVCSYKEGLKTLKLIDNIKNFS